MTDLFAYAKNLRDAGMSRAADAQERERPFKEQAYAAIVRVATRQPTVHIDDIIREGVVADRPNAWGSVWQKAIKRGVITFSGRYAPCRTDAKKHAHDYKVYTSCLFLGVAHD